MIPIFTTRTFRRVAALAAAGGLLCAGGLARAEGFDWGIKRVGALDYVPMSRIAAFYALDPEFFPTQSLVNLFGEDDTIEASSDSRQILINGVKHWLGYPVIEQDGELLVSRVDFVKTIEPSVRPERVPGLGGVRTVILDAGHGGADRGAVQGDVFEKDLNLDVCRKARELLESKGFEVVMTRDGDEFVPLIERARIANAHEDAIFISVHFNYSPNGSEANGLEVFAMTPRGTPSTDEMVVEARHMARHPGNDWDAKSLVLANCVQHAALGIMPQFDRGVKRARFAVLKHTRMPAVLLEGAFLSNSQDVSKAECASWRATLASAIVAAAVDFRQLAKTAQPPKLVADYTLPPEAEFALFGTSAGAAESSGPTVQLGAPN